MVDGLRHIKESRYDPVTQQYLPPFPDPHGRYHKDNAKLYWISIWHVTTILLNPLMAAAFLLHPSTLPSALHCFMIILIYLFTTIHDGNFRRHSLMNVTIKWHKFSSNIYYIYVFFVIWSWKLLELQFQLQMKKNRTLTPVYLDPGMHSGLEVKGLNHNDCKKIFQNIKSIHKNIFP